MWKRCTCFVSLIVMLALASGGAAYGAIDILKDPALVGWWTCDEGKGNVVHDSSPDHHDGTFYQGPPAWVTGIHGSAVELTIPTLIQIPAVNITMTQATMAGWIKPYGAQPDWASIMMTRGSATGLNVLGTYQLVYHWGDASTTWGYRGTAYVVNNEWTFAAVTVVPTQATFYINGVQICVNVVAHASVNWNAPIFLGGDGSGSFDIRRMTGALDDVSLFSRALSADEVKAIMQGLAKPELASGPVPADGAVDVPQDTSLSWTAGNHAAHDVYLGKSLADVNSASRTKPAGVLASQNQTGTSYDPPGLLDYGKTYYWRVDEVDALPSNTVYKGDVWSFTVEPYAYPITGVKATASSSQPGMGPERTADGSGLNASDEHGTDPTTMWMSAGKLPNWLQYEFGAPCKLYELWVWNSNQLVEPYIGFGAKNVTVEYSVDGVAWTMLAGVPQFAQGTGLSTYMANTVVKFGGVTAKYVKLTINKTWGGGATQAGLSEVRFSYVPVQARSPQPAAGATGVGVDTDLSWQAGREATSHKVYFGTDPNAVANGTAVAKTVTAHTFDAGSLMYGTTYYWKVDEVGAAATYPGVLWSFTTLELFDVVDDFESYNDTDNRIYNAWIDGYTDGLSGSMVGHLLAPFAERTIIHGGKQSMPMKYDNAGQYCYSQATRTFSPVQDWTLSGATDVSLWFRGLPISFLDKGDNAFTVSAGGNDIWNNADDFRFAYKKLTGNGSITAKVESIVNTNGWAKAGVMIRETLSAGSMHADLVVSVANSCSFQYRQSTNGASASVNWSGSAITAPYWVRLTRTGDLFRAETSPDGKTWTQLGTDTTILMATTVYIGLPVTAHDATQVTTAEFSNVSTNGSVTGAWQVAAIGIDPEPGNSPEQLYVMVYDSAGNGAGLFHPDPAATTATTWQQWRIPLSDFTFWGVKMTRVKWMVIGVGDPISSRAGGTGTIYIDDIGLGKLAATK